MDAEKDEDVARIAGLRTALQSVLGARVAVVDAWGVIYFDRLGVDELAALYKVLRRASDVGKPRLVISSPLSRRLLEESGINGLFDVYPTLDAALRALPTHN